jgi:prepilin-type N-terminal cleavage/methylation domain-containing protein
MIIPKNQRGFTLVEIMIVVAIIAILASIAVPSFLRARKRTFATQALSIAKLLEDSKDMYAMENGKGTGFVPNWSDLQPYVKHPDSLYNALSANTNPTDILQHSFVMNAIDVPIEVSSLTEAALSDVLPTPSYTFWGTYY